MDRTQTFDLVILGGGGAAALARRAGEAGWKVALIDPGPLGGTCPNRGCIPSKLLLEHATVAEQVRRAGRFHIEASVRGIDGDRILASVRAAISGTHDSIRRSLGPNVTYLRERGRFDGPRRVRVGRRVIVGRRIVIATGARPALPTVPKIEGVLVSDDVFGLERLPARLAIVGGGFIACELAHFFAGLGVEVTMLLRRGTLLANEDVDIRKAFRRAFEPRVRVLGGVEVAGVTSAANGLRVELRAKGTQQRRVDADLLLFAIGRIPNTEDLGLKAAGVRTDARGHIRVDARLRTSAAGVFALGDVNGRHPFTHAVSAQAQDLGDLLLTRRRAAKDHGPMPHAVFTDPEVGSVGATEQQLVARGRSYLKAIVRYAECAKGRAQKEEHGLAKLLTDRRGRILGFHVVGPQASLLLHQVVPLLRLDSHVSALLEPLTVHPSLNELVTETAARIALQLRKAARGRRPR